MGLSWVGVGPGSGDRGEGRVREEVRARVVGEEESGIGSACKGVWVVGVLCIGVWVVGGMCWWVVLVEHGGRSGAWWLCWGLPCGLGSCFAYFTILF